MPLPTFDKLDEVPEAFRSEYEERDGKAVPKELTGLKSALQKERERADTEERERKAIEKRIADIETKAKAKGAGVTDEALAQLRADLAKEKAPLEEELAKLRGENRTLKLDVQIKTLMGKSGVRGERVDVLWKLIADRFDLTTEGTPYVKDKTGTDPVEYLKTLKVEFPEFYAAPNASGSGSQASTGAGGAGGMDADAIIKNPGEALRRVRLA